MAERGISDPTEALSRASVFPTHSVPTGPGAPESEHPAPSSAFNGEDFLFHLYRGSELLQDNCVPEAKEELERALRFQPSDAAGQGLLGIVYFRLGMYPRAIGIYEELIRNFPHEISPKINLALCYLKTGQQHQARDVLEEVIHREPDHKRAWGYYGLALERLGEYGKAQVAFQHAGQPQLARRMQNRADEGAVALEPGETEHELDEVRLAAADAVQELDAQAPFISAPEEARELEPVRSRRWRAVEPGEEIVPVAPRASRPSTPPTRVAGLATADGRAAGHRRETARDHPGLALGASGRGRGRRARPARAAGDPRQYRRRSRRSRLRHPQRSAPCRPARRRGLHAERAAAQDAWPRFGRAVRWRRDAVDATRRHRHGRARGERRTQRRRARARR
jgi:tetratricopeptide (TPR) repeat protein